MWVNRFLKADVSAMMEDYFGRFGLKPRPPSFQFEFRVLPAVGVRR